MKSPTISTLSAAFQSLLDEAVAERVAPGFQCVVFDRDSLLFNGVSGHASVPSENAPDGVPFKQQTLAWIASVSKISISLIVLHIIERGLTKSGFSIEDLDSHEALVEVLPEFKHGSGSLVIKIIEGFEEDLGKDGKKVMKLRDANGRVTLRMLLTHTAGLGLYWNHPHMTDLYRPSDGSVPNFGIPSVTGDIRDSECPLVVEPNTTYLYSCSTDWLGQFVVRSTGKNLRQLFKTIIFEPLGLPPSEADIWLSPSLLDSQASMHVRDPTATNGFKHTPFYVYTTEGDPPSGKAHLAAACVFASLQAYSRVLQAVLKQDPRILSPELWEMAMKDDLKDRGIKIPRPEWKSNMLDWSADIDEFAKSTAADGAGVNLLQCRVATVPTITGRSAGSFAWAGLANTYFFIDPAKGIGAIFGTQLLPFYDPLVIEMRDNVERLVYETLFPV